MSALLFLACFIVVPASLTRTLVRRLMSGNPAASRGWIVRTCVPAGAIVPLLPITAIVALSNDIYNPWLIAIMATAIGALLVGMLVCLPVALAMTRNMRRHDTTF